MLLLERDGNICQCGCGYLFKSISEMRVDHIDGSESHNCLSNLQLLRHGCNIEKGFTEPNDTAWLSSSYPKSSRQKACVCVPTGRKSDEYESVHNVKPVSESWIVRRKEVKQDKVILHSIIPRDRQEMDDHEDTNTSSQSTNKKNEPKYCLYFMLRVKLGHRFRATDAKGEFALFLNIPHGTVRNHYYSKMSRYFERDEHGVFIDKRKQNVKPFIEESEIERMLTGRIDDSLLSLYADTLEMGTDELLQMLRDAPVLKEQTG